MIRQFLGFFAFCLVSSQSFATTYFIQDVRTSDASTELAASVKTLVISAVNDAGGKVSDSVSGADYTLRAELIKLGQAYVLTVFRLRGDNIEATARQKAASAEELDDATDRAVRAAIIGKASKEDMRVGEVKPRDRETLRNRVLSRNSHYLGFGPAAFTEMDFNGLGYNLAIGHDWEVSPHAAITFLLNGVLGNSFSTFLANAELGVHYFFTDADFSPFIGAGVGLGTSNGPNVDAVGGFSGSAGLGLEFFRTSSTQLELYASYTSIFGKNTDGAPGVASLRIGILY